MEYSARVGGGEGEMEAFGYLFLDVDLHGLTSNHTLADCDGRFSVTEVTLSGVIRNPTRRAASGATRSHR